MNTRTFEQLGGFIAAIALAMVTIAVFAAASSGGEQPSKPEPEIEVIHGCLGFGLPAHPEDLARTR